MTFYCEVCEPQCRTKQNALKKENEILKQEIEALKKENQTLNTEMSALLSLWKLI